VTESPTLIVLDAGTKLTFRGCAHAASGASEATSKSAAQLKSRPLVFPCAACALLGFNLFISIRGLIASSTPHHCSNGLFLRAAFAAVNALSVHRG
jgi:hypothetical protein